MRRPGRRGQRGAGREEGAAPSGCAASSPRLGSGRVPLPSSLSSGESPPSWCRPPSPDGFVCPPSGHSTRRLPGAARRTRLRSSLP